MADYVAQPIILREVQGLVIKQSGDQADVNGRWARMILSTEILSNPKHYLRAVLAPVMPRIESGDVAAVVIAEVAGKTAQILITAEQFALGAPERARHETWRVDVMGNETARQAKERAFDRGNNEGGEGYNPYRNGAEHTYDRASRRDRNDPDGA
jgi:hypothetical protein